MNESRVRDQTEPEQPQGLLIHTWGSEKTGMRFYAAPDGTLELWRVHGGIPRKMAHLVAGDDRDRFEWNELGMQHGFYWMDAWESKLWPVVAEHRQVTK